MFFQLLDTNDRAIMSNNFMAQKNLTIPAGCFRTNYNFKCFHCDKLIKRGEIATLANNNDIDRHPKSRRYSVVHLKCDMMSHWNDYNTIAYSNYLDITDFIKNNCFIEKTSSYILDLINTNKQVLILTNINNIPLFNVLINEKDIQNILKSVLLMKFENSYMLDLYLFNIEELCYIVHYNKIDLIIILKTLNTKHKFYESWKEYHKFLNLSEYRNYLLNLEQTYPTNQSLYLEESIEVDSEDDLDNLFVADENEESIKADSDDESNHTITISEWYSSFG